MELKHCRACGSGDLTLVLDYGLKHLNGFPLSNEPLPPQAPLRIAKCSSCHLVQLGDLLDPDLFFKSQDGFWYRSSTTGTMQQALYDIAQGVQERIQLRRGDVLVSVGCNDGFELSCYPSFLEKIGFEPAANVADMARDQGNVIVGDYFSAKGFQEVSGRKAKVIQAIACMYDINDLNGFLADVRTVLAEDGLFVAQFTGLKHTLLNNDIGNLTQEHACFFSLLALEPLFARHGLKIHDVEENTVNGGSVRIYAGGRRAATPWAWLQRTTQMKRDEQHMELNSEKPFVRFSENTEEIKGKVLDFVQKEERVYLYGASTKANLTAQIWGLNRSLVRGAAERDPRKYGRGMVADRIPIIPESAARADASAFIVMPLGFTTEFLEREREFRDAGGKMCFPLPSFSVF